MNYSLLGHDINNPRRTDQRLVVLLQVLVEMSKNRLDFHKKKAIFLNDIDIKQQSSFHCERRT